MFNIRQIDCIITGEHGLHARPAGLIVKEANRFTSDITVKNKDKSADAKKIFSLLALELRQGEVMSIIIEGEDEVGAAEALERLAQDYL